MVAAQELVQEEMERLLEILPPRVKSSLVREENLADLLEVVLDLGRLPEARFPSGDVILDDREVSREDLEYLVEQIGDFGDDNRAGMERTLHRISAIRNRKGQVVGITCRAGRAVFGTIKVIEDLAFANKNILLLGRPGVGKTTMLREVARVLADSARKRVVIVDTSNEIAGDGDVPHPAIGHARRMQVATPTRQHGVMIEAVENHMPQVIIIDEMGTEEEAAAARTIAERGVQLIGTAHGNTLDNLILNPTLCDLVGGIQSVTLGDQEARYRGTQKTVLERKAPPTFDVVVEIQSWEQVAVHDGVAQVVDQWLRGYPITPVMRSLGSDGEVMEQQGDPRPNSNPPAPWAQDFSGGYQEAGLRRAPVGTQARPQPGTANGAAGQLPAPVPTGLPQRQSRRRWRRRRVGRYRRIRGRKRRPYPRIAGLSVRREPGQAGRGPGRGWAERGHRQRTAPGVPGADHQDPLPAGRPTGSVSRVHGHAGVRAAEEHPAPTYRLPENAGQGTGSAGTGQRARPGGRGVQGNPGPGANGSGSGGATGPGRRVQRPTEPAAGLRAPLAALAGRAVQPGVHQPGPGAGTVGADLPDLDLIHE